MCVYVCVCVCVCVAERKEYARQSRASEEVMRERVSEVRDMVQEEQISKREIANGNTSHLYVT